MKYLGLVVVALNVAILFTACQPDNIDEPEIIEDPVVDDPNVGPPNGGNGGNNGNGGGNNGNNNGGNNGNNGNNNALSALPLNVLAPLNNPTDEASTELGRALFWDPILSGNMDVACATCHHPSQGYADGIPTSLGVGGQGLGRNRRGGTIITRNSPTIINSAFNGIDQNGNYNPSTAPMFWDNRDESLENQAIGPIHSLEEMRGENFTDAEIIPEILSRLNANDWYRVQFADAFGPNAITEANIGRAIAAFERTIVANDSPFDQFMRGDQTALSAQQQRGLATFQAVGCDDCHSGPMLSDFELHTLGIRERDNANPDVGGGQFNFRTPTLRNLALTAPYMHNGTFNSLQQVLDFYNRDNNNSQNNNVPNNQLDPELRNLGNINPGQRADIIAFLNSLNDNNFDRSVPISVPSGLEVGGAISNR